MSRPAWHGWIELASDVNWEDYGGMWAKQAPDGAWWVLRWTNMFDAAGESECRANGWPQYECEVRRLDLDDIAGVDLVSALRSCDLESRNGKIIADCGELEEPFATYAIVEACIGYGYGAPIESFTGDHYPMRIRAQARRYAEDMMRPESACDLDRRLERPVNAIMTSARDYGAGRFGL